MIHYTSLILLSHGNDSPLLLLFGFLKCSLLPFPFYNFTPSRSHTTKLQYLTTGDMVRYIIFKGAIVVFVFNVPGNF